MLQQGAWDIFMYNSITEEQRDKEHDITLGIGETAVSYKKHIIDADAYNSFL